mmetsp:Transcript_9312/g.14326  ORF Transcript_9312/g.14326 Transcript_9312/m.14326 type:complete len:357 (+) Transcript_9312:56-1126(+)
MHIPRLISLICLLVFAHGFRLQSHCDQTRTLLMNANDNFAELRSKAASPQNWLEFNPYYDHSKITTNKYKVKNALKGQIVSVRRIVGAGSPGEVCHIVIDHGGEMPYIEGQSVGIIPPGSDDKGKAYKPRLYSIASTRYGDDLAGQTVSFSVRRALYTDPETGKEDPAKKGVCSNFLCDAKPGEQVLMLGPSGKIMLIPEQDPNTDLIMVGTGTGVAPYRSFIRRLFSETSPHAARYSGVAWLFLGVANSDSLLYDQYFQSVKAAYPENFRLDYALSREHKNRQGGKMYIQDKMAEYADEIFERLDKGAHIYFCGLKGMMPGIETMLEQSAKERGREWGDVLKKLKDNGQWHVEVY